ncbi:thiol:disulfide interchange protein DsbD [Mucilaginibacter gossypiicola]|uniref:Thiol:disulfide interchange protein DsbD n=1 Tax=Mucilaginibacter gossypiicola TaxID=551995 RepID=A0A1H8NR34_9SPHI|nr:protein-disulfide reductase DsbD family protein [Mucilaginibacter gossypiicola]SEO32047.1 thiol:disulfide interchange protein DsbD [Mucilaginibacter gossypiicola]
MKKLHFILIAIFFCVNAKAQDLNPVKFRVYSKKISRVETEICMEARIDTGWQIYSLNIADGGPIKTQVTFKPSKYYRLSGAVSESARDSIYSDAFGMNIRYFKRRAIFIQKIITTKANIIIRGKLSYMANNDKMCLPPDSVNFELKIGG